MNEVIYKIRVLSVSSVGVFYFPLISQIITD